MNELIREYLEFNRYRYTNSVFLPGEHHCDWAPLCFLIFFLLESGQPEDPPFNREFLAKQLHIPETEHSVRMYVFHNQIEECLSYSLLPRLRSPLLYSIVALLQSGTPAVESKIPPLSFSSSSSSELPPFPPLSQAHLNASAVSHLPTSNFSQAAEPFVSSMQYTSSIGPQTNAHPSSMSSATETSKISALDADNREVPDVLLRRPSFGKGPLFFFFCLQMPTSVSEMYLCACASLFLVHLFQIVFGCCFFLWLHRYLRHNNRPAR